MCRIECAKTLATARASSRRLVSLVRARGSCRVVTRAIVVISPEKGLSKRLRTPAAPTRCSRVRLRWADRTTQERHATVRRCREDDITIPCTATVQCYSPRPAPLALQAGHRREKERTAAPDARNSRRLLLERRAAASAVTIGDDQDLFAADATSGGLDTQRRKCLRPSKIKKKTIGRVDAQRRFAEEGSRACSRLRAITRHGRRTVTLRSVFHVPRSTLILRFN